MSEIGESGATGWDDGLSQPVRRRWVGPSCAWVLVPILLVAGCDQKPKEPAGVPNPETRAADSSWGSFHVVYVPSPDPIPLNQLFALSVNVYEASDHKAPAVGTTVTVDARMPEHNHGMTLQTQVVREGDGRFRAEGLLFHMPGRWELYVDITREAEMERATFEIVLD